jgi:hypothetical protein
VERTSTPPAPESSPEPGREYYLPEYIYFVKTPGFPKIDAYRVTARCTARFANRFRAFPLFHREHVRAGDLPQSAHEREMHVESLITWLLEDFPDSPPVVDLFQNKLSLFIRGDLSPGILALTPDEFEQLRLCWHNDGLPGDLYYPASQQKVVTEPVRVPGGGIVLNTQIYTPLQWQQRDENLLRSVKLPSERERVRAFELACDRFRGAVTRRIEEHFEVGRKQQPEHISRLHSLLGLLNEAAIAEEELSRDERRDG